MLFNTKLLQLHRDYGADNMYKSDFLLQFAAEDLLKDLEPLNLDWDSINDVLEIGARIGYLSKLIIPYKSDLVVTEISKKMLDKNPAKNKLQIGLDDLPFEENSQDLILSSMNLHWVNDVRNYAKAIYTILRKDGIFAVNFVGDGSFVNLKKAIIKAEADSNIPHSQHVIPLIHAENIYRLFQEAGFTFIIVGQEEITLEYDSPVTLMKELKNMGENNALNISGNALPRSIYNNSGVFEDKVTLVSLLVKK
ncbi:MAG UNVERIFIED_CONTAM: methyltransferase domain-containing protein [Rickettsiaceae bacterium]|jgi:SAM-dependent methyltransferase